MEGQVCGLLAASRAPTCGLQQLQPQPLLQELQGDLLPRPTGPPEVQGYLIDGVAPNIAVDRRSHSLHHATTEKALRGASSTPYRQVSAILSMMGFSVWDQYLKHSQTEEFLPKKALSVGTCLPFCQPSPRGSCFLPQGGTGSQQNPHPCPGLSSAAWLHTKPSPSHCKVQARGQSTWQESHYQ